MSYKAVPHLEHADCLEVATYREKHAEKPLPGRYGPIDSITVECTKCGEVVEEIYNASEDNTPPLDCEFTDIYRIYSSKEELWWSNEDGWGDLASATVFNAKDRAVLNLPIEGQWICFAKEES